jgi:glycosyltransferase involved in cell wall biosynthesis
MRILFIAPIPPPHTGNSLPVFKLYEFLKMNHDVFVVKTNKKEHKAGITSIRRVFQILNIFRLIFFNHNKYDVVYLSIAESKTGNLRDLFIYFLLRKRLNSVFIHMFGGAAISDILNPSESIIFKINEFYLSRLKGIIVEGETQKSAFLNVAKSENIYVVPNFAEDYLFMSKQKIENKFSNNGQLSILFLSNMLTGKGHIELLKAFLQLPINLKNLVKLELAGKVVSEREQFFELINGQQNITYHGVVSGDAKKELFFNSHIFCLPTYYPYEGQPFSIVEAFAAGCAVITTSHSGIVNIFKDKLNGIEVEKGSVVSLCEALEMAIDNRENLMVYGLNNFIQAKSNHTQERYLNSMASIILSKVS